MRYKTYVKKINDTLTKYKTDIDTLDSMYLAGHKCEMCGRLEKHSKGLQIHHISYRNLGHEDVANDLICLCGRCHILIHAYYNRKRA